MKRFKNILFFQGANEARTPLLKALSLAQSNHARLKIVGVYEALPEKIDSRLKERYGLDLIAVTRLELTERLRELVPRERTRGGQLTVKPLFGTPFIKIIREVLRENHDLVITGTDEQSGLKKRLFGSTTMHLMRKCPCPVWVIKPTKKRKFATILAAIDVMSAGKLQDKQNIKIMELSSSLAMMEGSKLHILHCWSQPLEGVSRRYSNLSKNRVSEIVNETQSLHDQSLHAFIERFDLKKVPHQIHLLKGQPGQVITGFAKRKKADLVVMGTVSRVGISGLLIGNTAEKVLSDINASVLTVKPDEFQSPVK